MQVNFWDRADYLVTEGPCCLRYQTGSWLYQNSWAQSLEKCKFVIAFDHKSFVVFADSLIVFIVMLIALCTSRYVVG